MKPLCSVFLAALLVVLVGACSKTEPVKTHPGPLGLESIPDDEPKAIEDTKEVLAEFLRKEYPAGKRPARRDAHAKAHGCVKAEFRVPELAEELRVGLFKQPGTYNAWIRFSNGNPTPRADKIGDGRGMAIKVMGVPGEKLLEAERDAQTQDFVMINAPVFFVDTAANYFVFQRDLQDNDPLSYFIGVRNPSTWHLRGAEIARALTKKKVVNPLETQYWSMAPYLFGDRAMKYTAKPCEIHEGLYKATDSPDFLAENMAANLASGEGCFEFMVQFQGDPEKMPVEDPTVEWDEKASPFTKVADIRIPSQSFRSDEQMSFCENLSMTPWHALPEHRPLGGINRLRRVVYENGSRLRHEMNGTTPKEPTAGADFLPTGAPATGADTPAAGEDAPAGEAPEAEAPTTGEDEPAGEAAAPSDP